MESPQKPITMFEAASLVAGIGVGGGIMAVPYLASRTGLMPIVVLVAIAYGISLLLHLMIAEIVLRDGTEKQLVELFIRYVFRGKLAGAPVWLFFALLAAGFLFSLTGYLAGCAEILMNLLGFSRKTGTLVSYLFAAGVVLFGLKAVGWIEKWAIAGLALIITILSITSAGNATQPIPVLSGDVAENMALFGMLMFSFACFWSVPQAVKGLSHNKKRIAPAIALGIGINAVFVLAITFAVLAVSNPVTEVAINGWGNALGGFALVLGSLAVLLAMITSYWATSLAFAVILKERLALSYRLGWFLATAPTLALGLADLTGFMGFMRITGGAIAVMLAVLVIPAVRASRRMTPDTAIAFHLGFFGETGMQLVVVAAYLLMAAGSLVPVN